MTRQNQTNRPLAAESERELLDKVYAVFDTAKLTKGRHERPLPSAKCATPHLATVVSDLARHYEVLSPETKSEVEKYIRLVKEGEAYRVEYVSREDG
jgi:hypothetical protein